MTLPPLPPSDLGTVRIGRVDQDMGHSDEAMRAYAEQAVAAEPAQEPGIEYKRGYEDALNDCIKNGGEAWARSMFANNAEHIKPVQAPLLWYRDIGAGPMLCNPDRQDAHPLYAAPQQPMRCPTDGGECGAGGYCRPEQRKPLTRDELLSLWKQHGYKSAMCEPFARAVEEAHGITGEPE